MDLSKKAIMLHKKFQGKLETISKIKINNLADLSLVYTPGVGSVSSYIANHPAEAPNLTLKGRTVAVVTDGSAVLGLGNLGAEAALPVMEGKCLLFKTFANLDAFPICLNTQDVDEIVETVKIISPSFAAINLEDISAPRCFEIEEKLQDLKIPVMHDDQHGTAIAILGPLMNAVKVVKKNWFQLKVVISGAGAAGTTIAKMLTCHGLDTQYCSRVGDVVILDSKGIIYNGRQDLSGYSPRPPLADSGTVISYGNYQQAVVSYGNYKKDLASFTNKQNLTGGLEEALVGADVFIGVSAPGILKPQFIRKMAKDPIIFAMANPVPEIMPDLAKKAGAKIVATGRSDFPNQVNNALAFPGVFKGAIEAAAKKITPKMKLAAAQALAGIIKKPSIERISPSIFNPKVVREISKAVANAA